MAVDYDAMLEWIESRFSDVRISGKEIKVNSIFVDDRKHHLWICPEKGTFHCWKSDEGGTLVKLVAHVDGCSFGEAAEKIGDTKSGGGGSISQLEKRLQELQEGLLRPKAETKMVLPPNTFPIKSLSEDNRYRLMAEEYLRGRKLSVGNLMICTSGEYRDRIVIPYYGRKGELIYWNGRDLTGKAYLRYRGPKKDEVGVGKDEVLWIEDWPKPKTKVYMTEGEFDAMSLNLTGLAAAACGGKAVSEKQMELLKHCHVAISFDADKSGSGALNKLGEVFEKYADVQVTFVRPPTAYKDWNQMLADAGPRVIRAYIEQNEKPFNGSWTANKLIFNSR
jgi:DNA primase